SGVEGLNKAGAPLVDVALRIAHKLDPAEAWGARRLDAESCGIVARVKMQMRRWAGRADADTTRGPDQELIGRSASEVSTLRIGPNERAVMESLRLTTGGEAVLSARGIERAARDGRPGVG